jgi:tetratricopeptide (TPR) repeat protein
MLLALLLSLAPSAASAAWREATTNHFVVYSEDSPQALRAYAEKLERFDKALRVLHNLPDEPPTTASRVTVYVLPNVDAVARLYGVKTQGSVYGFYVPRAGGSILYTPRPKAGEHVLELSGQTVLLHEYAHHYMLRNFSAAFPAWYIEGFAEFASTAGFPEDGSVEIGRPANHRAASVLSQAHLTVEEMLGGSTAKLSVAEREDLYGRGWLLTHYLTFDPGRKGHLRTYLKALNAGKPPLEAASGAFGDLKQLGRDLNRYRMGKLRYITIPAASIGGAEVKIRELSPGENATMAVRLRSDRGVTLEQAQKLLPDARKAAAPYPNDAAAQLMLAEAEYDAGNDAEADAAAARALAADAASGGAMMYRGMVRLRQARSGKGDKAALLKEARRWFVQANRRDQGNPDPLLYFYHSFDGAPTPNAVEGLMTAFELAPHDPELRMLAIHRLLSDEKLPEARTALATLAYSPHSPLAKLASALIAGIDSGKSSGKELVQALEEGSKPEKAAA